MAAYGALSSLLLTLDSILDHNQPVSLDRRQLGCLRGKVRLLRQCLGERPSRSAERIRDMASRAADLIVDAMHRDRRYLLSVFDRLHLLAHGLLLLSMCWVGAWIVGLRLGVLCWVCAGILGLRLGVLQTITKFFLMCALNCIVIFLLERERFFSWLPSLLLFVKKYTSLLVRNETDGRVLSKMLEEIDGIVDDVKEINFGVEVEDPRRRLRPRDAASLSRRHEHVVVGIDEDVDNMKARLLLHGPSKLEIVTIVGMGGIGKTTLARRVYEDSHISCHFDVCTWVTVSQDHQLLRLLQEILDSAKLLTAKMRKESDDGALGDYLYKTLKDRRYLIVMDDVWDIEIWDAVRRSFPDDNNGSRVLLTTRLSEVAHCASFNNLPHRMHFLDQRHSWKLLADRVFGGKDCPQELEEIGKEAVKNCKGLPLAIVVVAGLLSKIPRTRQEWRRFADNLSSAAIENDNEGMEILALSYTHLPQHLRPCFLYMGMFPEDYAIPAAKLMWLWAAEGFLQSDTFTSPEELAEEYLKDLVERNLILVLTRSSQGKIKTCTIHDVLRNLCLAQARKEKFLFVAKRHLDVLEGGRESSCRLSIHPSVLERHPNILFEELYNSRAHSLLCIGTINRISQHRNYLRYRLLRVLDLLTVHFSMFPLEIPYLISLRYLALTFTGTLHPNISKLQHLQAIVHWDVTPHRDTFLPIQIWMLPNLRHLIIPSHCLSNPPSGRNTFILQSFQTLAKVMNLTLGDDILTRIRSLKKLSISYNIMLPSFMGWYVHRPEKLVHLDQLEKLTLWVHSGIPSRGLHLPSLTFPRSLKNLTLGGCRIPWEEMTLLVGALPNLEVLRLNHDACRGAEWAPIEGQFRKLKSLLLRRMDDLVQWTADDTHYPRLQSLAINTCRGLTEIPSGFADIPTLETIELVDCHPLVATSAEKIREEQRDMGDSGLNLRIYYARSFEETTRRSQGNEPIGSSEEFTFEESTFGLEPIW